MSKLSDTKADDSILIRLIDIWIFMETNQLTIGSIKLRIYDNIICSSRDGFYRVNQILHGRVSAIVASVVVEAWSRADCN
jgi:hypothetical protein